MIDIRERYTTQHISELLKEAEVASKRAHAPYSKFYVGAVAVLKSGERVSASNFENVSYGLSCCAERNLMARLNHDQCVKDVELLVVYTKASPPSAPCGMCRQVLVEFFDDLLILMGNDRGEHRFLTLRTLFPEGFNRAELISGQTD